jgi:hypothetical protein
MLDSDSPTTLAFVELKKTEKETLPLSERLRRHKA